VVAFALVSVAAPAAQAHSIAGFMWTIVDNDCASGTCVTQGNQVGTWQSILWADGLLNKCGSSGIDGYFGSVTKTATQTWQRTHGLSADGVVGPLTWGAARKRMTFISRAFLPGRSGRPLTPVQYWDYVGSAHTVHFQYSDPVWAFRAPANGKPLPYFATTHPSIFFTRC
jgi:Putative peptidoglycan binding domain